LGIGWWGVAYFIVPMLLHGWSEGNVGLVYKHARARYVQENESSRGAVVFTNTSVCSRAKIKRA
jgi:hypothetical protein